MRSLVNALNWFEIPVTNMERAAQFYGAIYDVDLDAQEAMPGYQMAQFPIESGVGGALLQGKDYTPAPAAVARCTS